MRYSLCLSRTIRVADSPVFIGRHMKCLILVMTSLSLFYSPVNARGQAKSSCFAVPYAELADDVYKDDNAQKPFTPYVGRSFTSAESGVWTRISSYSFGAEGGIFEKSGGFGALYENSQGDLVVAFRGTQFSSKRDWLNNIIQGLTGDALQHQQARKLALQIKAKYPGRNIVFTGHSLGGALAQDAAAVTGFEAVTFNPAAMGNFPGRRDALQANRPVINNYITQDDVLDDIANPLSDAYGVNFDQKKGTQSVGNNIRVGVVGQYSDKLEFHDPTLSSMLNEGGILDQLAEEMNQKYNIPVEKQDVFRKAVYAARKAASDAARESAASKPSIFHPIENLKNIKNSADNLIKIKDTASKAIEAFMDTYGDVFDEKITAHLMSTMIPQLQKACHDEQQNAAHILQNNSTKPQSSQTQNATPYKWPKPIKW